jgi:histidine decarboxylase
VDILGLKTFGQLGSLCYPHQNPLQPGQPWPREVPCHQGKKKGPGSIDINALAQLVEFFAHQGHPIIVCLTVGTGFKGGYDDVELAGQTLLPILAKYGLARLDVPTTVGQERRKGKEEAALDVALPDKYWFHVDGALAATYLPFLEMAYYSGRFALRPPVFDFRLPFVNSITTSFHKWIGMPWPAGLFMTKTKFRRQDASGIPLGTIFSGSRNALTPVMLWDFFARNSFEVLIEKAISSQEVADYAVDQLKRLEKELGQDLLIGRAELSLSIRFKQVNDNIAAKYSLSEEVLQFGEEGQAEHYSVIFVMNHVSKQLIDQLIGDLRTQGAFKSSSDFAEVKSRVHGRGFR